MPLLGAPHGEASVAQTAYRCTTNVALDRMRTVLPLSNVSPPSRVVRVVAPNPSPLTLDGTNSYLVLGAGEALAIDPGPLEPSHLAALETAAAERTCRIAAIAVTHGHADHFPGAAVLAERTGAPVYAHRAARFPHDRSVGDSESIAVRGATLRAYEAPGHAPDHLVFWFVPELALFAGDVILGRGTVAISPPEGDMRAYQATLRRLRIEFWAARAIYGGHGEPILEPRAKIDEYLAHRERREREIAAALALGDATLARLTARVYPGVTPSLQAVAGRQVLAYLIALEREGRVRTIRDATDGSARYALVA